MKIIGVLLIVVGLVGILYGGLSFTHRDKVVDAGPIQITKDKKESVPIPPIIGGVLLVAGVALVMRPDHSA